MKQFLSIILIAFILTGCPATFYGNIKNESGYSVTILRSNKSSNSWVISSGDTMKIKWYQECLTVKDGNTILYFSVWPVPKEAISHGAFSSTLSATYKNNGLYFDLPEGEYLKIKKVDSCKKR